MKVGEKFIVPTEKNDREYTISSIDSLSITVSWGPVGREMSTKYSKISAEYFFSNKNWVHTKKQLRRDKLNKINNL